MGYKNNSATLGLALVLASTGMAAAVQPKHDKSVELAAAKLAAKKIGEIRGSIDHDQKPFLVEAPKDKMPTGTVSTLPRPSWVPEPDRKVLPPMVSNAQDELDRTMTGSIMKPKLPPVNLPTATKWDRFDKNGRQIRTYD